MPRAGEWGTKTGMRAALTILLCLSAASAWADDRVGSTGELLGWHPKSTSFAYTLTTRSRYEPTRVTTFMKHVGTKGTRASRMSYGGSVRDRVRNEKFVRPVALLGRRESQYVQAFPLHDGRVLRVVLDVRSKKLGYTVWLHSRGSADDRKRLLGGSFDELWTDLDAQAFPSPDGQWVALVLTMETSFRTLTWVEGVLVGKKQ